MKQFKENTEKNNTGFLYRGYNSTTKFITTDEAVKEIAKYNEELKKECDELRNKIKELNIKQNELYDSIDSLELKNKLYNNYVISICKMTYWKFRKWRKDYIKNNK